MDQVDADASRGRNSPIRQDEELAGTSLWASVRMLYAGCFLLLHFLVFTSSSSSLFYFLDGLFTPPARGGHVKITQIHLEASRRR